MPLIALFQEFSISILYKLDVFPIYDDDLTKKHYREICKKIDEVEDCTNKYLKRGRFYVNKCRPIYAYGKLYYELTLTKATNYPNLARTYFVKLYIYFQQLKD